MSSIIFDCIVMAKQRSRVYLGFEDGGISDKNQTLVNYTINKIGGSPDWPPVDNIHLPSKCPLCGLHRILVTQCYAPLESSQYHRTLYIFACISPNCWTQSESWLCVRCQHLDSSTETSTRVVVPTETNTWCNGADEWDDNDNGDTANGNFMNVDNAPSPNNGMPRNSDDEEESNSFEVETMEQALGNLNFFDAHNANMSPVQGAVGAVGIMMPVAELEGSEESGLVSVDSPLVPSADIETLLHQTSELPAELRSRLMHAPLQFAPKFIYVEEEWRKSVAAGDERVNELLNKYKKENDPLEVMGAERGNGACGAAEDEAYEEATPLHGDTLFHSFLTRLRQNPGQILRYSREEPPLLGAPVSTAGSPESPSLPTSCSRCGTRLICELQLVPEFAHTLKLLPSNATLSHLHFLSVLVFTCSNSCWQPGDTIVRETVVFQPEV